MNKNKSSHLNRYLAVIGTLIYTGTVQAGGFQVTELSARLQGQRNAGAAAGAGDTAATVYFNPAGLTRLSGQRAEGGLHVIIPKFKFTDKQSTNAVGGVPIGKRKNDGGKNALVPNFYYSREINPQLTFGLGTTSPYGLVTEYDKSWVGRYQAVKSDLLTVDINPSVGYRINDDFSVGGGVSVQYVDAELTNALDFGTIGFLAGIPGVTPSTPQFDGFNKLTGDDWSWGFNLGAMYEFNPGSRIGIGYRSEISHTLDGKVKISIPEAVGGVIGQASTKRDAKADFKSPASVWLGGYHQIDERWAVAAGATWTDWSSFKELRVEFDDGGADSVQPENWRDSWRYSLGVNYFYDPQWTLRAGFEFDDSPVRKADRTPRIPDQDRYWFTLGASYVYSNSFTFDFAYSYIHLPDYDISDTEVTTGALTGAPVGNTLDGEYKADAHIISAQAQWNF